jgi:serine/threonine-protein kinase
MGQHGRYKIAKKIADGGMAEIFLATQSGAEGFERTVILKRILPGLSADPTFRNMLVDEAHIAMSLNHGNIVQVLDLGRSNGRYFLVMELVDGWDLATVWARARAAGEPLPLPLTLYVLAEVCRGLAYAHGMKRAGRPLAIVHRDISPQNVLLSQQGEVKVTDFGIAKALGKRERTQAGVIKGKLDFMSPEQASGAPLDARSDIFAVGTMLYLLATGKRPFAAGSDLETLVRVQNADFPAPLDVHPDLDPDVAAIIDRAMCKAPSDRFADAEEMMLAIEEVLRGRYRSAGQSDLKRWLRALAEKDGAPPVSDLPGLPVDEDSDIKLVGTGHLLALDDTSVVSAFDHTQMNEVTPTPVTRPAVRVSAPAGGDRASPEAPPARPAAASAPDRPSRARPRRRGRGLTLLTLGAAAAAGALLLVGDPRAVFGPEVDRPVDPAPVPPASSSPPQAEGARAEVPGAQIEEVGPATPEAPAEPPAEVQEAPLAVAETVPGPEHAPPGEPAPVAEPDGRSPARPEARRRVELRILTRPPGASVVGRQGTLGTTPFTFPSAAGARHQLTFAKNGFSSITRRITADPRRATVIVELEPVKPVRKRRR